MTEPSPGVAALAAARAEVLARIAAACERVGRDPADVTLVAVSKTVDADRLRDAVAAGLTLLGENRVQEGAAKAAEVPGARWQLIGPLQSNKARRALEVYEPIQSVESVGLAERLDRLAREVRGSGPADRYPMLLQVNVDDDPAKAGFHRVLHAALELQDEHLLAGEELEHVAKLLEVEPAPGRVADRGQPHPVPLLLGHPLQPRGRGAVAGHRIAEHDQDAGLRGRLAQQGDRPEVGEIARGPLADQLSRGSREQRGVLGRDVIGRVARARSGRSSGPPCRAESAGSAGGAASSRTTSWFRSAGRRSRRTWGAPSPTPAGSRGSQAARSRASAGPPDVKE